MDSGSVLAAIEGQRGSSARTRRHYRHAVTSLAYIRLDHGNGGIIRNISESGIAIQAVGRLHSDQLVHLRFELLKPKIRIDITGQVTWADLAGQAGLRFIDVPPRAQRQLRDWIFNDLLAIATEFGPSRSPIFANNFDEETGGLLSVQSPPRIRIPKDEEFEAVKLQVAAQEMPLRFPWWPLDIYPGTLARFVDSLVVVSSVLLFAVIAIGTVGEFPSTMVAAGLALGLFAILAAVYYWFFKFIMGTTVGRRLANIAGEDGHWVQQTEEKVTRFR